MAAHDSTEHPGVAALRAAIAEIEELISELPPASRSRVRQEEKLAQLRAELAALETAAAAPAESNHAREGAGDQLAQHANQSNQAGGNSAGAFNTFGDHAHIGDVLAQHNYYGAEAADVAPLLRTYLHELSGVCSRLSLADADSLDPSQASLDLQAVYVGLEIERQVPLPPEDPARLRERAISVINQWGFAGPEEYAAAYSVTVETALQYVVGLVSPKEQQRRLRAVEALAAHPRLVITGHPGSGKSSLVNFVSLALAGAWCGDQTALVHLGDDWPHGALLPIRVVLREFGAWLEAHSAPPGDEAGLFWRWLEQGSGLARLLVQHLRATCADGKAVLFLDGLDEVPLGPGGQTLRRVMAVLDALGRGRSRVVVTCRVLDYQQAERRLPDWPVEVIAPLAQPLREQLVAHWFTALERLKRPTRGSPPVLRDGLIRAIQARPELRRLAGNPLLLTMMIRLQAHDGELPGEQVTLYRRSVDLLLLQWRRDAAGRVGLGSLLELPQWSDSHLNRLLDRLAYVAHERGVSGDSEQGADLPRQILLDTAAQFFAPYDPDRDQERAQKFLNYISAHSNGIIQRHDQQIYRFPHRTFQEYLAGRRLISDEGWPDELPEFVDRALACSARGPQWRGALLLAVSQHTLEGRLRPVFNLADELLARYRRDHAAGDLLLAAELLREPGRERVEQQRPELWASVRAELALLLRAHDTQQRPPVAVAERGRAGFLLGAFGDPRMPTDLAQWRAEVASLSAPEAAGYFCRIPGGDYRIGSAADDPEAFDDERPQHVIKPAQTYWVARLPLTNTQWQLWVAQGGTASRYADDDDLNHPNQPVVGIDWHAANAYCAWLSAQLADILPPGYILRLPTEAEWEVAARGPQARRYPWGDTWREDCAATEEDQATRGWQWTMPVGCYPAGATPEGLLDMAGNVREWTLSRWQSYPGASKHFTNEKLVVVRGGAYNSKRTYVRCGARDRVHPDYFLYYVRGFRVVVAPRLAHLS